MLAELESGKLAELARVDEEVATVLLERAAQVESPELPEQEDLTAAAEPVGQVVELQPAEIVQDDAAEDDKA